MYTFYLRNKTPAAVVANITNRNTDDKYYKYWSEKTPEEAVPVVNLTNKYTEKEMQILPILKKYKYRDITNTDIQSNQDLQY